MDVHVSCTCAVLGGSVLLAGTHAGALFSLGTRHGATSCAAVAKVATHGSDDDADRTDALDVVCGVSLHHGPVMDVCTSTTHLVATAGHDAVCCVVPLSMFVRPSDKAAATTCFARTTTTTTTATALSADAPVCRLRKHTLPVVAVRFFADGVTLASLAADGRLLLTRIARGGHRLLSATTTTMMTTMLDVSCGFAASTLVLSADETCCFVAGRQLACVDCQHARRAQTAYDMPHTLDHHSNASSSRDAAHVGDTRRAHDQPQPHPRQRERSDDTSHACVRVFAFYPDDTCDGDATHVHGQTTVRRDRGRAWLANVHVHEVVVDAHSGDVHAVLARTSECALRRAGDGDSCHAEQLQHDVGAVAFAVATWPSHSTTLAPLPPRRYTLLDARVRGDVDKDKDDGSAGAARQGGESADAEAAYAAWARALVTQLQTRRQRWREERQQCGVRLARRPPAPACHVTLAEWVGDTPWSAVCMRVHGGDDDDDKDDVTSSRHSLLQTADAAYDHTVGVDDDNDDDDDVQLLAAQQRHAVLQRECGERMLLLKALVAQRAAAGHARRAAPVTDLESDSSRTHKRSRLD